MKVILTTNVPSLGSTGDMVNVKPGFARNYLIPQKKAIIATVGNVKQLEHEKQLVAKKVEAERKDAESVAKKLESMSVTILRHAGEEDKLFGSVTKKDIAEAIQKEGVEVHSASIKIDEPIKQLGTFDVSVKLFSDVQVQVKVWVMAST